MKIKFLYFACLTLIFFLIEKNLFSEEMDLTPYVISAKASSVQERKFPPEYGFDGNLTTRWSSAFRNGEWIEGYFACPAQIQTLYIYWETARASAYTIFLKGEKTDWIEVSNEKERSGEKDVIHLTSPIQATAIRIRCDRKATQWGNSIFEIQAFGKVSLPPPSKNLIGWQYSPTPWESHEREISQKLLSLSKQDPMSSSTMSDDAFLDLIQKRAFDFFWWESYPENGLTKDRGRNFMSSEECTAASTASVGFALSAYVVGAQRGWVSKPEAVERVKNTLKAYADGPIRNVHGFFPHFLDFFTGKDLPGTEISTIDTTLFLCGLISAQEYFKDTEITALSTKIFDRVDWDWAKNHHPDFVSHGVSANGQFIDTYWGTTTEGLSVYLLALGSSKHGLTGKSWDAVDHHTDETNGYSFVCEYGFQSIFRFQYPLLWYDFRNKTDRSGVNYFNNATIAALAMRDYCLSQSARFPKSYSKDLWGLGAADGPGNVYMIYGFPPGDPYSPVDGTVIPYAMAGSINLIPQHVIHALRNLYDHHHACWGKYGFSDSLNPEQDFVSRDVIGLDLGTILIAIENHRSELIWKLFMKSDWMKETTRKIGWTLSPSSQDPGGPIDLARTCAWRFKKGDGEFASSDLNDEKWDSITVPDQWENENPSFKNYDGIGWYRTSFHLDPQRLKQWQSKSIPIALTIGGVDDEETAYINGRKTGQTIAGPDVFRKTRHYTIPVKTLHSGKNVIAIRVNDAGGMGGIWLSPVEIGPLANQK